MKILTIILSVLLTFTLYSCGGDDSASPGDVVNVDNNEIDDSELDLASLTMTLRGADNKESDFAISGATGYKLCLFGKELSSTKKNFINTACVPNSNLGDDDDIEWRSSDESVVTVEQNGALQMHNPGEVTIFAAYDGIDCELTFDTLNMTVNEIGEAGLVGDIKNISLTMSDKPGKDYELELSFVDEDGNSDKKAVIKDIKNFINESDYFDVEKGDKAKFKVKPLKVGSGKGLIISDVKVDGVNELYTSGEIPVEVDDYQEMTIEIEPAHVSSQAKTNSQESLATLIPGGPEHNVIAKVDGRDISGNIYVELKFGENEKYMSLEEVIDEFSSITMTKGEKSTLIKLSDNFEDEVIQREYATRNTIDMNIFLRVMQFKGSCDDGEFKCKEVLAKIDLRPVCSDDPECSPVCPGDPECPPACPGDTECPPLPPKAYGFRILSNSDLKVTNDDKVIVLSSGSYVSSVQNTDESLMTYNLVGKFLDETTDVIGVQLVELNDSGDVIDVINFADVLNGDPIFSPACSVYEDDTRKSGDPEKDTIFLSVKSASEADFIDDSCNISGEPLRTIDTVEALDINTLYLSTEELSLDTSGIKPVIPDFDNTSGNKSFEAFASKMFFNLHPNNMENNGNLSISQGNDVELHIHYDTDLGLYNLIISSEDYQDFSNDDQDAQFYAKSMDLDTEFDLDPACQLNLANTASERNENCTDLNTSTFDVKFLDLINEVTTIYIMGENEDINEVWSRYPGEEWEKLGVLDGNPVTLEPALNTCVWDGTVCKVQEFILKNPTIDKYTVEVDKGNNEALCQFTSGVLKDGACVSLDTVPVEYSTKVDVANDDVSKTEVVYAIGASVDKYYRKYSKYEFDLECLAEQTSTLTFTPDTESDLAVETDFEISKVQGDKCYHRKNKNDGSHETELLIEIDLKSNQ